VNSFLEDLAELVPPTTKLLCRLQDVSCELLELSTEFIQSGMISDLRMSITGCHLDKRWLLSAHPEDLVGAQGTDNHLGDGVENPTFPIVVIGDEVGVTLRISLNS
jgi:hypothetical protein